MAAILALAALLRMGWPGVNSFSFDEARISLMALQMARRGEFARVGLPSSVGVPNFPAAVWIFALPYRFSKDPLVATSFVGLLGTIAVAGIWWLARKAWGTWAGLSAALLFAASPYAVLYSRGIWGQDLLPPLAVLWAAAGAFGISERKPWALALHAFLAGLAFQVHYAGVVLIPVTIWLVIRHRLWEHWLALLVGGAGAALCALPFVLTIWCCAPEVWTVLRALAQQPARIDLTAFRQAAEMGIGMNWEWLLLGRDWRWQPPLLQLGKGASILTAILILLGVGVLLWRRWREHGRWPVISATLVLAWALAAPLAFTRHNTPAYHQYQLATLPAFFLIAGATAGWVRRRAWGIAITFIASIVAVAQAIPLAKGLSVVATELTPGGLGTPLMWPSAAARSLMDGQPIVVHAHGDSPDYFGDVAGFHVLLWDYPHRIVDGRSVLLVPELKPSRPSVHLLATFADLPAWEEIESSGLVGEFRSFPRRKGEPPYVALTLTGGQPSGFQRIEPLSLANGAQLWGWRVREIEGRMRFGTWWKLSGPLVAGDYHQFNHLYAAGVEKPIVRDVPLSSQAWQEGDNLITWVDFERPSAEGPFWVEVGMYTWPQIQRVPVLNRKEDPLAPIRLGPFYVSGP